MTGSALIVSIVSESACSSCHSKSACTMADFQDKEIEIPQQNSKFLPGQSVTVLFRESLGFKALFYGYMLPFVFVLFTLVFISSKSNNEALAGLLALSILVPYYITLYFFRHYLKKVFKFEVEEIE